MTIPLDKCAILLVDMLNDFAFEGGDKLLSHTNQILPNVKKLKQFARDQDLPLIYVNDHYGIWQADPQRITSTCENGANQHIIQDIKPDASDFFLIKPQHSAFFQTPLQSLLMELGKTHLIMAGIAGDICLLFTAKDAYMYGYTMHIPQNCTASEEKEGTEYSLYLMRTVMKAATDPI
ncbi:cysteine hydrolase [Barrientosiimonas marina]|uniref:Isochorismatase family cysteine hydrolase n=1 Tax=Lentibacillus kimchii TaxID=1542911 RepID=A0ABW2UT95_9BACI